MTTRTHLAGLLVLALAVAAAAQPALYWSPSGEQINSGTQLTLSVMLDEPLDVRTIELRVRFDHNVIASIEGGPGTLFDGFNLFADFDLEETNQWHGYCVILGADDWAVGPGELYSWTIEGLPPGGESPIVAVDLALLPADNGDYDGATLATDRVFVLDVTAAPLPPAEPTLSLYPNPFNPRARMEVTLPGGGPARLEVVNLRGRVVAQPWSGAIHDGDRPLIVDWSGIDALGRPLPSGVYTFRLVGARGLAAATRGVLVR